MTGRISFNFSKGRPCVFQPDVRHLSSSQDEDKNLKGPATSEEVSQFPSSLKL
jgi:hypothetical protein